MTYDILAGVITLLGGAVMMGLGYFIRVNLVNRKLNSDPQISSSMDSEYTLIKRGEPLPLLSLKSVVIVAIDMILNMPRITFDVGLAGMGLIAFIYGIWYNIRFVI